MLLRNLDPPKFCNETHLVIKKAMQYVLQVNVLSGCGKGEDVFIPRIPLIPSGVDIPFAFHHLQFSLRVCFAMSINKSQGQTLSVAGLHLDESCFSHGQLYVSCSQLGSKESLFVYLPRGRT
uniref:ATP-dependent DNA helicase n=1 Tax=Octopus bimaculoides TaxID=37653 RepID=A0A0L8FSF5_OCTBM